MFCWTAGRSNLGPSRGVWIVRRQLLQGQFGSQQRGGAGASAPLKVAVIPVTSGPYALFGQDTLRAEQLAADEANASGGVAGHKVQLVVEPTDGTPVNTVRAAKKAVTEDGAKIITGILSSPEQSALQPQLAGLGAVEIVRATDDVLTGAACSPNAFRVSQSDSMAIKTLALKLGSLLKRTWVIQATDISSGHTAAKNFSAAVRNAGGHIVLAQYAPSGTTDFGSYISKLNSAGADALFAAEYGADAVAFINQAAQFKLFDKLKTVVGSNMIVDPLFKPLGSKIIGFYNDLRYSTTINTPSNQQFVKAWESKYGTSPYFVPAGYYIGMQVLFAAVDKAQSVDPQKIQQALSDVSANTLLGQASMRPQDHQLLLPTYVGKVVSQGNQLAWQVVGTASPSETTPSPSPDCHL